MNNSKLENLIVLPFIRQADYASRSPWSYGERRILDYLLVYVDRGHCRFHVNKVPYELYEGDYCLVQPGDLVLLEGLTPTTTPFAHFDFFFNPLREKSFPTSSGMTHLSQYSHLLQPKLNDMPGIQIPIRFQPSQPLIFKNKFLRMIGRWMSGSMLGKIEVQQLGMELFLELMNDFSNEKTIDENRPTHMERVVSFISLHLHKQITIEEMAEQVHLSPSHFSKLFKDAYGISPYQYLYQLRMDRAKNLLQHETNLTATQISEHCGFSNIQHFSKSFFKTYNITPSAYRKNINSIK